VLEVSASLLYFSPLKSMGSFTVKSFTVNMPITKNTVKSFTVNMPITKNLFC